MMDLLAAIERERLEIADSLASLSAEQWATQSCCDQWTVQEVAAHLTQVWNYSTARGMIQLLKERGDLGKMSARFLAPLAAAGPEAIIADLRANAANPVKPPVVGLRSPLNDVVLHRRDMFLPLEIHYEPHLDTLANSLDLAVGRGVIGMVNSRKALRGLSFTATDLDWSHGEGPAVTGQALPLAHAMWGRTASLSELTGPGVEILTRQLATA